MNCFQGIGRFTDNPQLKKTNNGTSVLTFTLAIDRRYQKQGEEKQVDYIDCVAWKNTAETISKYFLKGSKIGIVGNIQTRSYEDKNGNKRKVTECIIDGFDFCEKKEKDANIKVPEMYEVPEDDNLPF